MRRITLLAVPLLLVACTATVDTGLSDEVDELRGQITALEDDMATLSETVDGLDSGPAPEPELPVFPAEFTDLTHGGEVWAVVLGVSEAFFDPALTTSVLAATEAGYSTGPTDCDEGVVEILGLPTDRTFYTVSVYFETEADAQAALDAFAARGLGAAVGQVQTLCLD